MAKKKRADKYEEKLKVNGSFEDLLKALVPPEKKVPQALPKLANPKPKK